MERLPEKERIEMLAPYDQLSDTLKIAACILAQEHPLPDEARRSAKMLLDAVIERHPHANRRDAESSVYGAVIELSPLLPDERDRYVTLRKRARRWVDPITKTSSGSSDNISSGSSRRERKWPMKAAKWFGK